MSIIKTLLLLLTLLSIDGIVNFNVAMESPSHATQATTEEIDRLASDVRNRYYNLVIQQVERPIKNDDRGDFGLGVDVSGRTLKRKLNLSELGCPGRDLPYFYRKFLTTDQSYFAAHLFALARMQGKFADPSKGYAVDSCDLIKIHIFNYKDGAILGQYKLLNENDVQVTLCGFFVNSLKATPTFNNLTPIEINQIRDNLNSFNQHITDFYYKTKLTPPN